MKKTLTLLAFLISLAAVSQNVQKEVSKKGTYGLAGGRTTEKVVQKSSQEKIYQNSNSCFSGIKYKVKNTGKFSGDTTNYSWWIMFTNTYKKPVAFSYRLLVGGTQFGGGTFLRTYTLKPGESFTNDWGSLKAMLFPSSSDKYEVEIKEVCFNDDDCIRNGYAECGGKGVSNKNQKNISIPVTNNGSEILISPSTNSTNVGQICKDFFKKLGYTFFEENIYVNPVANSKEVEIKFTAFTAFIYVNTDSYIIYLRSFKTQENYNKLQMELNKIKSNSIFYKDSFSIKK